MKIKLQGIGIIKDSEIELNGLTVITGDNNSGKTTVGKVVYSLFDAVSDLTEKAEADKNYCARLALNKVKSSLECFSFIFYNKNYTTFSGLSLLFSNMRRYSQIRSHAVFYANKIYDEIKEFREVWTDVLDDDTIKTLFSRIARTYFKGDVEHSEIVEFIDDIFDQSFTILEKLFVLFDDDPQLIDYARQNIFQTLKVEFMEQIQPVKADVDSSLIVVEDNKNTCFFVDIEDNKIINNNEPVYFISSIKNVFLVDNPFILDYGDSIYESDFPIYKDDGSFLNKNRIIPHGVKLNNYLRRNDNTTILEANILEKQYSKINAKMSEVISGDFDFTDDGDYYIDKGRKLRFSNLATGSKLFSILKLLINKGALTESTVLVLDEPEAHLHPAWQNKFAEIIVMLVKELNVKVLLTSHSPNFVLAIDAFMRKYKINDKTNFYQTRFTADDFAEYINVNDDMGLIYSDFVQYLTEVKLLRDMYYRGAVGNDDQ